MSAEDSQLITRILEARKERTRQLREKVDDILPDLAKRIPQGGEVAKGTPET